MHMCPGPVNSNIQDSAPWPLNVLIKKLVLDWFPSPNVAAVPVVRFVLQNPKAIEFHSHYHMWEERPARADAQDARVGKFVYDETIKLFSRPEFQAPQESYGRPDQLA